MVFSTFLTCHGGYLWLVPVGGPYGCLVRLAAPPGCPMAGAPGCPVVGSCGRFVWLVHLFGSFGWVQLVGSFGWCMWLVHLVGTFVYSEVARQPLPNAPLTVERSYEAPDGTLYEYSFELKVRLLPEWDEFAGSMGFVRVSPAVDQSGNPWTAKSKMVFFEIALNRLT